MGYVGDLAAKEAAMLELVQRLRNAGQETQACALLRTYTENLIDERQDWMTSCDRLAELTKYMPPAASLDEVNHQLSIRIDVLEEALRRAQDMADGYECSE